MSWESLYTVGQIAGVALVAVTFAVGTFTVYAGWRANKIQKEENRVKEEQYEREKLAYNENIANANAEAAKANEGLARASEKIAQANERAQNAVATAAEARLKQEELALESRTKQKELAEAQTTLIEEQRKLADAQQKQAEAELALQKTLEDISKRQGPRVLTQEQRATIIRAIKEMNPLSMRIPRQSISMLIPRLSILVVDVKEAANYATQLNEAFIAAGCDTVIIGQPSFVPPIYGIVIRPGIPPHSIFFIERALDKAGINYAIDETTRAPQATIVVGYKASF